MDEEQFRSGEKARVAHEVLGGLLKKEGGLCVEELVVHGQVSRGGVALKILQGSTVCN